MVLYRTDSLDRCYCERHAFLIVGENPNHLQGRTRLKHATKAEALYPRNQDGSE
jgi:hypothetical protein